MKKSLSIASALIIATTLITGCGSDKTTADKPTDKASTPAATEKSPSPTTEKSADDTKSGGLTIEKSILGKKDKKTEKITPVEDPTFKKGDVIAFVLINVGKFAKDKDGKNSFDIDMELKDSKEKTIGEKKGMLGEAGNTALKNDTAESPYGFIDTGVTNLEPGEYTIKLTIYDKIGGGKASETETFKIQ